VTTVRDIAVHCSQQEKAKSAGPDAVPMECFIFGGTRLYIHLCILFNCFIRYGYLPKPFMQSLIIPLLKVKSGNVTDEDNYRAIAVSTAVSKFFSVLLLMRLSMYQTMICISLVLRKDIQLGFVLIFLNIL